MVLRVADRCNSTNLVSVPNTLAWGSSPVLPGLTAVTKDKSHGTNPKIKKRR